MKMKVFPCGHLDTNCYLVWSDLSQQAVIIDPGYPSSALSQFLSKEELVPNFIILTHGHGDHTGGIAALKEKYPDIQLIASKKEKKFLFDRKISYGEGGIDCEIYVDDGEELALNGLIFKFISTPGHTPGGMCILVDRVLFSGDTLFRASVGRSDFPGGNAQDLVFSIKNKLFILPEDTRVFPGHSEETTIGYEKRYNPFV